MDGPEREKSSPQHLGVWHPVELGSGKVGLWGSKA